MRGGTQIIQQLLAWLVGHRFLHGINRRHNGNIRNLSTFGRDDFARVNQADAFQLNLQAFDGLRDHQSGTWQTLLFGMNLCPGLSLHTGALNKHLRGVRAMQGIPQRAVDAFEPAEPRRR